MGRRFSLSLLPTLFLVVVVTGAMGAPCSNVLPGLNRMLRGIDVAYLDLMPLDATSSEDGFRSPVVDFTCDQGRTRNVGGVTYNEPDQVWVVSGIPTGSLTSSVQIMKTSNEVRNALDVSAGVEVNAKKFAFSASTSYSRIQRTVLEKEKYVESLAASFAGRHVELQHVDKLALGADAQREIDELPPVYLRGTAAYNRFIRQFGTHYMSEAKFGGLLTMYTETEAVYHETHDEQTVKVQVSATFSKAVTARGGTSVSSATTDSEFTSKSSSSIRYYGGSSNLIDSDGIRRWQPTIGSNPWLYSTKLGRISDLIRDPDRRYSMSEAIDDYLRRQYVTVELRRILDSLPYTVQSDVPTDLRRAIDGAADKYPVAESDVDFLRERVDATYKRLLIQYDNSRAQFSWWTTYDKPASFTCPAGKTIVGIKSRHDNGKEDRQWRFLCAYTPSMRPLHHCRWTGWLNSYDNALQYVCPGIGAIKGWYSVHNRKEDRMHKFMCCDTSGFEESDCYWDAYKNDFDRDMDFTYSPSKQLIRGASSFHDNRKEDRRWKFNVCNVE